MKESLFDAKNELKRVDHQIYVSLKYTRTVDVLLNTVSRMIDAYTCMVDSLLKLAVESKIVLEDAVPLSPLERGSLVKGLFSDEIVQKNMDLYFLLRKIFKSPPITKEQEFRRHVASITIINGKEEKIDIDILTEYYDQIKEFHEWIDKKLNEFDE